MSILALSALPPPAHSATNVARGGIGAVDNGTLAGGDGTGSAAISIEITRLELVKTARDVDGILLPDGATIVPGTEIWFVLHVDNSTDHPTDAVEILDPLDETAFSYVSGSLGETTRPTGSDADAIWAGAWTPLSDASGDDEGSVIDTGGAAAPDRVAIGDVSGQPGQPLVVPSGTVRAFRFRVRVN